MKGLKKGSETAQRGQNGDIRGQGETTMPEERGVSTRNAPDLPEGFKTTELGPLRETWLVEWLGEGSATKERV